MSSTLTYDEAVAVLPDGDTIHCFRNPAAGVMLGTDWDRATVLDTLKQADVIGVTGEHAQAMHHGIVIKHGGSLAFFETVRRTDD